MRFLILAHSRDDTAMYVKASLVSRHPVDQVKLLTSEELVYAPHWSHRLGDGNPITELTLADKTVLSSKDFGVVFNRLRYVSVPHFELAKEDDRNFAVMEMYALLLSWLASLPCPVINPASPRGLGAQERSQAEWLCLASQAGLPIQGYAFSSDPRAFRNRGFLPHWRETSLDEDGAWALKKVSPILVGRHPTFYLEPAEDIRQEVLVVGEQVIGELAGQFAEGLHRLAELSGCELLKVVFAPTGGGRFNGDGSNNRWKENSLWRVSKLSAFPQVREPNEIEAIVDLLESRQSRKISR